MSAYQLTGEPWIYRIDDQARIHPDHPDYQDYLNWLSEGNTPLPPTPEQIAEVRDSMGCTPLQGIQALLSNPITSTLFDEWMNSPSRTLMEKVYIQRADTWRRNSPIIISAANDMGLSDEQVDDLFRTAMEIEI